VKAIEDIGKFLIVDDNEKNLETAEDTPDFGYVKPFKLPPA